MTRTFAKILAPLLEAFSNGATLQFKDSSGGWNDYRPSGDWFFINPKHECERRIKPQPKLRAWTADEVPVGAIVRNCKPNNFDEVPPPYTSRQMIVAQIGLWIVIQGLTKTNEFSCKALFESKSEHSTDGGKNWLPCGVME